MQQIGEIAETFLQKLLEESKRNLTMLYERHKGDITSIAKEGGVSVEKVIESLRFHGLPVNH